MKQLRPYQEAALKGLFNWLFTENTGHPLLVAPVGCHAKGTKILLADGRLKKVEDVIIGDLLLSPFGGKRTVLRLCRGREKMYEIHPTKGQPFLVNASHMLSLKQTQDRSDHAFYKNGSQRKQTTISGQIENISVRDFLTKSKYKQSLLKLWKPSPVEFLSNKTTLPICPYMIGLLLGDGSLQHQIGITTADKEIVDEIVAFAQREMISVRIAEKINNKAKSYYFYSNSSSRSKSNPLTDKIKELGLYGRSSSDKFIPYNYKTSTIDERLEILAGLMDSDGSKSGGGFDYISKSETLANDVVFICRSLGLSSYKKECYKRDQNGRGGIYYRVSISGDCSVIPCRINRKKTHKRLQKKDNKRTGFRVIEKNIDDFFGFELDGDHLYMDEHFNVHHNSGKSLIIAEFIRQVHEDFPRTRILLLTHIKELLLQNAEELRGQYPDCDFGFYCAGLGQKRLHNDVTFATIQSVNGKFAEFNRCPELIIIDECFTGETLINTNKGLVRIDKVGLGDIVYNATGYGEISAISKKVSSVIYKVRLSNGQEIRCTGNHPFFTKRGWTPARNLDKWEELVSIQDMSELWEDLSSLEVNCKKKRKGGSNSAAPNKFWKNKVLLNLLLKEDGECDVGDGCKGKNAADIKKNRAQAVCAWWQRQGFIKSASDDVGDIGRGLASGACYTNRGSKINADIPDLLQSGLRTQKKKTGNRAGRAEPLREKEGLGRQKRCFFGVARVESVEVEECGRGEIVYNLQINGHPSYFANGFLVHNCHLLSHNDSTTYRKFIDSVHAINPNCKVIGLTGTPFRADTGRLDAGHGKLFDGVCYEIPMKYMIEEGYWAKPITPKVETKMSVDGVGSRGGDYIVGQLEKAINLDHITDACVRELIQHGKSRHKWLVFTAAVQHCTDVTKAIRGAGINAAMVTGETPGNERSFIIEQFRRGEIQCLVNVAVLTTGFNVPDVDLLAFMRPTRSPVLYIQMTGRGIRPVYADGYDLSTKEGRLAAIAASKKPNCLIMDFGGVIDALGAIDAVDIRKKNIEKTEGEEEKKAPSTKVCPACGEMCMSGQRYCYNCSYCFIELDNKPAENAVVSVDETPRTLKVLNWTRRVNAKPGKIPSMLVTYFTETEKVYDTVCFNHPKGSFPHDKARHWHKIFLQGSKVEAFPMPENVQEGVDYKFYEMPQKITVKRDGKYFRVTDYDFNRICKAKAIYGEEEYYEIPYV